LETKDLIMWLAIPKPCGTTEDFTLSGTQLGNAPLNTLLS